MDKLKVGVGESSYSGNGSVADKLDRARTELLDLSARNRLLNMPRSGKRSKIIELVDELSGEVFRLLVGENKAFTFVPGMPSRKASSTTDDVIGNDDGNKALSDDEDTDVIKDLALPEDDEVDSRGVAGRHSDTRLQTRFTPEGLQKRLLDLYYDARTLEDEQGVNVLYLTLGALRWVDPNDKKNIRYAPLLLIPVTLERGTAGERFRLRARPEDFATNLSLENFLDRLHGIRLPEVEISDAFDLPFYLDAVEKAVDSKEGWGVERDVIVLGFFSFAKFMMYRDLDPSNWPTSAPIVSKPLLKGLLADGFEGTEELIPDDVSIDHIIPPSDMLHILDSDSSQTLAVHEVRKGRNLVIQGPPGTGKSQTIANLIAAAVADGKTVLFVAEKMAALEVVKRRLDVTGVGAACLELHSHKANKKAVLEEIRRTWENGPPRTGDIGSLNARLRDLRDELNSHATRMHERHPVSDLSPYQVIGQLVRLRAAGEQPNDIKLDTPENWNKEGFDERHSVLRELVERVLEIGNPSTHLWHGVELSTVTPMEVERLTARLKRVSSTSAELETKVMKLAEALETSVPVSWRDVPPLVKLAHRLNSAPLPPEVLAAPQWNGDRTKLIGVVEAGEALTNIRQTLFGRFHDEAWKNDFAEARGALDALSATTTEADFEVIGELARILPDAIEVSISLAEQLSEASPATIDDMVRLTRVGECIAVAPSVSGAALSDPVWEEDSLVPADVVAALRNYQAAREELSGKLADAAWSTDLVAARSTLASHGTGLLRALSGEWRRANRLVRSCLASPDQDLNATLAQLDRLQQGKAALMETSKDEAIAQAAFGGLWRGERSDTSQLETVVEWMAKLGDAGSDVRQIIGRKPDRSAVARLSGQLEKISRIKECADLLSRLLREPVGSTSTADIAATADRLAEADRVTRAMFVQSPPSLGERLKLLDLLDEGQVTTRRIDELAVFAGDAFGALWTGIKSDWSELRNATQWVSENVDILNLAGRLVERKETAALAAEIEEKAEEIGNDIDSIAADLQLDLTKAFGKASEEIPLARVTERLFDWSEAGESLFQWTAYRDRAQKGRALGCRDIVDRLSDGRLAPDRVISAFEMAYYEALYAELARIEPEIARFDGTLHSKKVAEFSELDLLRIRVSADETVKSHHNQMPPRDGGAIGPLGVLRNELQKRRGHMPIRKLVERAGPALQALKPVFMMSPLSVAQFLAPGVMEFDLLVMDEASQIQPVDALGAVARARQVVVVGDPRQLPPTSFFARMTGGGDDDEDDGGRVADIESILGLFTARGLPMRMLRWHYRSRHQSLIAVSNRQFYESKLFVVPSPYTAEAGMGLRFHHIPDGIFDTGGKRCNIIEARVVARAIIQHALEFPELSLGVAAFSVAQRRAILDELELLRRAQPETEGFFLAHPAEPFFVKNLENVQGDERDVIFISVGYGPTVPGGRVPMRFGPLGSEGGERRLNVLISRAKQRCEVFASLTDEDIDPDFAQSRKGVFAFRMFLQFARTGRLTMAEATGRDHDSVFEEQVANALHEKGYQVHRQVGLAGFFIDLAVSDPQRPGRYLLGIECDGASYHDALSARDRDRLRQSVLESHGWLIHRIWSTDWFQRPQQELSRVIEAIEAAKAEDETREAKRQKPVVTFTYEDMGDITLVGMEAGEAHELTPEQGAVNLYQEAVLERDDHVSVELHEVPRGILIEYVEKVVEIEGPVCFDEVVTRIREAWGLKRAGGRIRDAIAAAVDLAERKGSIKRSGDFVSIEGRQPVLRNRSSATSAGVRKPEAVSLEEIVVGALALVEANFGATSEQLVTEISRGLGFKATSDVLRRRIVEGIEKARSDGHLIEENGLLQATSS
ncbi:DUF3320 domain-containing protein [Paracoccus saliphilus]|uniref:AAA domain-containing protein n=1 Tax=Paracoccus saliphilus TaxID=405559 RepID=A0AA46A7F4_9RHOB|nr:DUF3320 domain-containing protein [Paracoccus saliphilus]WCR04804.1 DUF3320 domain-containing protein [Paracoccus saliphilus]SIT12807.1 AAA domain-containing protein [Paracoccus saliphilus]